jgi:hypothetical protein
MAPVRSRRIETTFTEVGKGAAQEVGVLAEAGVLPEVLGRFTKLTSSGASGRREGGFDGTERPFRKSPRRSLAGIVRIVNQWCGAGKGRGKPG